MDHTIDSKALKPSLAEARKWVETIAAGDLLPFAFQYGGRAAAEGSKATIHSVHRDTEI